MNAITIGTVMGIIAIAYTFTVILPLAGIIKGWVKILLDKEKLAS